MPSTLKSKLGEEGFTIPLVMCAILLISSISVVLIQVSHDQIKLISKWQGYIDLEEKTEALLNQCEKYIPSGLIGQQALSYPMTCCAIESSSAAKNKTYFRVFVSAIQKDLHNTASSPSTSRLETVWTIENSETRSKGKNSTALQRLSWREVIDLDWEHTINQQHAQIWENLAACPIN